MRQSRHFNFRWAPVLALLACIGALAPASAQAAGPGGASAFATPKGAGTSTGQFAFTSWRSGHASWYGPGLYGNSTACGKRLRPATLGVAHKTLPCGTAVKFRHRGNVLITRVIDRGPYIAGRTWDLTEAASEILDFESVGVGRVQYAVAAKFARSARK